MPVCATTLEPAVPETFLKTWQFPGNLVTRVHSFLSLIFGGPLVWLSSIDLSAFALLLELLTLVPVVTSQDTMLTFSDIFLLPWLPSLPLLLLLLSHSQQFLFMVAVQDTQLVMKVKSRQQKIIQDMIFVFDLM